MPWQKRLQKFKSDALARKRQRQQWDRVLQKNERERQAKLNKEAKFIYKEAVSSYSNKLWERARDGFLETQQIFPGYKRSEKYLSQIDADIERDEQQRVLEVNKAFEGQRQAHYEYQIL